ncbi:hypothetical protein QBC36DRAFT_69023 [Triangularia setosa]|uniref:Uncharacterized protein n=1 Tax=Triangularia setosa TaxID=2587417 RepID=A0AAN7A8U6_9PEZI|nr:hypothetical protein QBC36DRAFT_69023 [Podospora setosa]
MTYLFYSTLTLLTFTLTTLAYVLRAHWLPHLSHSRTASYLYSRLPGNSSFEADIEAGLSSSNFDLNTNLAAGDSRSGLDEAAKREILQIMKKRRVKFDEARKVYMEQRFAANGIGADGRPRDPKFVSFS